MTKALTANWHVNCYTVNPLQSQKVILSYSDRRKNANLLANVNNLPFWSPQLVPWLAFRRLRNALQLVPDWSWTFTDEILQTQDDFTPRNCRLLQC